MASELYHKIDQVNFNWELLVNDNAGSIFKHKLLLKVFLYFSIRVACNAACTWIIVCRVDRLRALHDKPRNYHKNRSWRGIP